jgi:hypothetical protein
MTAATVLPGAGAFITSGSGQALVYESVRREAPLIPPATRPGASDGQP